MRFPLGELIAEEEADSKKHCVEFVLVAETMEEAQTVAELLHIVSTAVFKTQQRLLTTTCTRRSY